MRTVPLSMLAAIVILASCGASSSPAGDQVVTAKAHAIDGDTLALDYRLDGVDAVERRQLCERAGACYACGKLAQDALSRMLKSGNATVRMTGGMTYGRPVAIVSVNGYDVGEQMILQGLAIPAVKYIRNDAARGQRYVAGFAEAHRAKRGIHAGTWIAPANWRRGERLSCEQR